MTWLTRPAAETQITHGQRLWLYIFVALILLFLIVPTLIVVPMSFSDAQYLEFPPSRWSTRWYDAYLGSDKWMRATGTSVRVAILTTIVATILGTLAAYALSNSRRRGRRAIFLLLITPIIVPVILIAVGAFAVFSRVGLGNSIVGLVLAHTALALPLVVIVVLAGLRGSDPDQEMAARSLGASRPRAFLLITLPQIRFPVMAAALLAFLTSLDEVVVASFISGGANATLTKHMFAALRDYIDPTIAAISTLLVLVSALVALGIQTIGWWRTHEAAPVRE